MPELAEIRLTSDFVNRSSEGVIYQQIRKNPISKNIDIDAGFKNFTIHSTARGKELKLNLTNVDTGEMKSLIITAGMSGTFRKTSYGNDLKHTMLSFDGNISRQDSCSLSFLDHRRFGKWHWGDWNPDRSPDPTLEYEAFVDKIRANLHTRKFKKPIFEILMDQDYFNGIGNYLRAVIVHRSGVNPFIPSSVAIKEHPHILELCRQVPLEAYALGGGELKDWENPFTEGKGKKKEWAKWIFPYQKGSYILGEGDRRFWFDKRWDPRLKKEDKRLDF